MTMRALQVRLREIRAMTDWKQAVLGAALCSGLAVASAGATPISYQFTVNAIDGPLSGETSSGTFAFDASSVTTGGSNAEVGLLTRLDFIWGGITYDATAANTGRLDFDVAGNLTRAVFGTNCAAGPCAVAAGHDEWFVDVSIANGTGTFAYATSLTSSVFGGTARATPIPEPASILLFALALAVATLKRTDTRQAGLFLHAVVRANPLACLGGP
jgi:hypothetical protein